MARTNIDLDDELVAEVMRRYRVKTKKEAVDLALRRLVGEPLTREFLLSLEGIGWEGDLDEMRRSDVVELSAAVVTKALRRYQRQLLAERDAEIYRETGGYPDLAGVAHLTPLTPD